MLITGVSGLLGNNLSCYFRNKFEILGLFNRHPVYIENIRTRKCDLMDRNGIIEIVNEFHPHIIVHCASLTNIDQCELEKSTTKAINVDATKYIVQAIDGQEAKLIYISTDAVYDGVNGNFSESDDITPQNYYGQSKYEGELEILKKENSLIFRTNIFGWNIQEKESLGEWILEALKKGQAIHGFRDAIFSSIYTMEFAKILDIALQKELNGLFNCASINPCSKYHFSTKIADLFGFDQSCINPISIDEFGFRAKRGKDLSLDVSKLQNALNYKMPTIEYSIESFYRDSRCGLLQDIKKGQITYKTEDGFISYGRQWIDNRDVQSVCDVLTSAWITQGPKVQEFEEALADFCGAKFAVAVNSGTSGLHIACLAAGISSNQEVVTSPITFVASANCVAYCGGIPVFVDIDPKTYTIDPDKVQDSINSNTRGVIPVHFAGQSCDMDKISEIVKKTEKQFGEKIWIIEDACHAMGSTYRGTQIGSCSYSDMVVMSFHPVKHITTGEGGVVLTNDEMLYRKLLKFRSHGITSSPEDFKYPERAGLSRDCLEVESMNPWYYEQNDLGWNYRITDIQCALGLSQIKKLDLFIKRRRDIVRVYNQAFLAIDSLTIPYESPDCNSNFHLYVLLFDFEQFGISRPHFIRELREQGIQTQVHYIPVHTQPYYQEKYGTRWGDLPNAESYYNKCLSIPLYPLMNDADVDKVVQEISNRITSAGQSNG